MNGIRWMEIYPFFLPILCAEKNILNTFDLLSVSLFYITSHLSLPVILNIIFRKCFMFIHTLFHTQYSTAQTIFPKWVSYKRYSIVLAPSIVFTIHNESLPHSQPATHMAKFSATQLIRTWHIKFTSSYLMLILTYTTQKQQQQNVCVVVYVYPVRIDILYHYTKVQLIIQYKYMCSAI